jgi:uncharacterized membrane protein (UPF0182 family)
VVGDRLIYRETLQLALADLYAGKVTSILPTQDASKTDGPAPTATVIATEVATEVVTRTETFPQDASIELANQYFLAAQTCAGKGDWVCYGTNLDLLGKVLQELSDAQGGASK